MSTDCSRQQQQESRAGNALARARLGENRYHILRNNCEHFCEWCLSGVSRSRQLESLLGRLGAAAIVMVDAIAAWAHRARGQTTQASSAEI